MVNKVERKSGRIQRWETAEIKYISGTIKGFIQQLRTDFEQLVPEAYWETATLDLEKEYDYGDSVTPIIRISWNRPETDEEFKVRQESEATQLEYRRKQYEQLKKEFG